MWEYEYDESADETTIYWQNEEQASVDGKITGWQNGYPLGEAREVISQTIEGAGTPERIRMHFDLNYGFEERSD